MENYGFFSYLSSSIGYFILLILVLVRSRDNSINIYFALAILGSLAWASFTAYSLINTSYYISESFPLDTLSYSLWFVFLIALLVQQQYNNNYISLIKSWKLYLLFFILALTFLLEFSYDFYTFLQLITGHDTRLIAHILLSIIGLSIIEFMYRNADTSQRWAVKFICLGLGFLYTYDFIIFSKSLLYSRLDLNLWESRGFIHLLLMPLFAVSINRIQKHTITPVEIPISRQIVFPTAILFGTGVYLIIMSMAGYYIKNSGGNLGQTILPIFISLSILSFFVLSLSHQVRAKVRIGFTKHFFQFNYDYRAQWLELSKSLTTLDGQNNLSSLIIKTMADLVDSSGGGLWLKNDQGNFYLAKQENLGFQTLQMIDSNDSVIQFLNKKHWIIDFIEYSNSPQTYQNLDLSQWLTETKNVWIIIPLIKQDEIQAFVVISQPLVTRQLNWEDHDILKTVAMQLSNALALSRTNDKLARSRQFEAYNQLSAYLVHDLKNLVSQVSLIVKNAEIHKHNPEFIDDSIDTLKNVSEKLQHLVGQLKKGPKEASDQNIIDLVKIINDVNQQQAGNIPQITLSILPKICLIKGDSSRMVAILGHLVQNAQEATDKNGWVKLELNKNKQHAIIKISDNGSGMDNAFISERLFKPFDTTKGNAGMGIGVYEAQDYIRKQSGLINVKSAIDQGTTFTITLPLI